MLVSRFCCLMWMCMWKSARVTVRIHTPRLMKAQWNCSVAFFSEYSVSLGKLWVSIPFYDCTFYGKQPLKAWELHLKFAHPAIIWNTFTLLGSWTTIWTSLRSGVYKSHPSCERICFGRCFHLLSTWCKMHTYATPIYAETIASLLKSGSASLLHKVLKEMHEAQPCLLV